MKNTFIMASILGLFIFALGCPATPFNPCKRSNASVENLDDKLNTVKNCPSPVYPSCDNGRNYVEWEEKQIYLFQNVPYTSLPTLYTPEIQDDYIEQAKNLAQDQTPNCSSGSKKTIYKMVFSSGLHPYENPVDAKKYLYVIVTYACCSGNPQDF